MWEQRWQPSATGAALKARAQLLAKVRTFFADRQIIEIDTPLLCQAPASAPHLHSFAVHCESENGKPCVRYLQTSPEYALKRLIAAWNEPVYYLGKAFRAGEVGSRHNPEFTMLEWYRPGWDHLQLLKEVEALLTFTLDLYPAQIVTYGDLFKKYFDLDPHLAAIEQLQGAAVAQKWIASEAIPALDRDGWLDLLFTHGIEPHLGTTCPVAVIDFPGSQASLAKKRLMTGQPAYEVADRFEFYYQGVELANGYHELTCAQEQRARFMADLEKRASMGLSSLPMDEALLAALGAGFPDCAGVALGFDRLLMLKLGETELARVLPFAWERA